MKKIVIILVAFVLIGVGAKFILDKEGTKVQNEIIENQVVEQEQSESIDPEIFVAPDFVVYDFDGNKKTMADFNDKPMVINFFSSKCSPCKKEMPGFQAAYDIYKDDYNFIMISAIKALGETEKTAKKYIEKEGFTFPVYLDTDLTSQINYGVYSIPTTLILTKDGIIKRAQAGIVSEEALNIALADVLVEIAEEAK